MAQYARVHNGLVAEIVDLDPAMHNAWVLAGNPKAASYRPLHVDPVPQHDAATQTVDMYHVVAADRVTRAYRIRAKTAEEKRKTWTPLQFLERFTTAELDAVENAVPNDPIVRQFYRAASFATEIVSDDPRTVAGMNYLVSEGILTMARKDAILGA